VRQTDRQTEQPLAALTALTALTSNSIRRALKTSLRYWRFSVFRSPSSQLTQLPPIFDNNTAPVLILSSLPSAKTFGFALLHAPAGYSAVIHA